MTEDIDLEGNMHTQDFTGEMDFTVEVLFVAWCLIVIFAAIVSRVWF